MTGDRSGLYGNEMMDDQGRLVLEGEELPDGEYAVDVRIRLAGREFVLHIEHNPKGWDGGRKFDLMIAADLDEGDSRRYVGQEWIYWNEAIEKPKTYRSPLVCPDCDRPILAEFNNVDEFRFYCEVPGCSAPVIIPERFFEDLLHGRVELEEITT